MTRATMDRIAQLTSIVGCGLPAVVFLALAVLEDHGVEYNALWRLWFPNARELFLVVQFVGGFGAVILMPVMWITYRFAARSLSRRSKYPLVAFMVVSSLGSLYFWLNFIHL